MITHWDRRLSRGLFLFFFIFIFSDGNSNTFRFLYGRDGFQEILENVFIHRTDRSTLLLLLLRDWSVPIVANVPDQFWHHRTALSPIDMKHGETKLHKEKDLTDVLDDSDAITFDMIRLS